MKKAINKKRLERAEAAIAKETEPEHKFLISIGLAEEYGGTGTKFFVDGKEVSEKVYYSYPQDHIRQFKVSLVKDEHGDE